MFLPPHWMERAAAGAGSDVKAVQRMGCDGMWEQSGLPPPDLMNARGRGWGQQLRTNTHGLLT